MHQGPWIFRGLVVMIEDYDRKGKPSAVNIERITVWAQIHDIPDIYRSLPVVDQQARRIGHVKSIEMNPNRVFEGNYVRVKARIEVAQPLTRVTPLNINGKERIFLPVKYEKLGYFCEVCGILVHVLEECGDVVTSMGMK